MIAGYAQAQAPSLVRATAARPIEVELVSAGRAVVPGETTWVAVRLKPNPGWHTYWRYAGDVGSSFSATWDLPDGWNAGAFIWPVPHRIPSPPLASYGYEREQYLVAPIEVPLSARVGSTARIAGRVTWVVCKEECVSDDVDLSIIRPVLSTAAIDSAVTSAIVAERRRAPLPQGEWAVRASVDSFDVIILARPPFGSRERAMVDSASRAGATPQVDFFVDSAAVINHAAPVRARWTNSLLELRVQRSEYANGAPPRVSGIVVFGNPDSVGTGANIAVEIAAPVEASVGEARVALGAPAGEATSVDVRALLAAALLGLLGGTLLNLMPCVLPVLSIKLFGLVDMGSRSGRSAKRHGLRFGAGILLSMWVLVGILLALRAAGNEIGWGYQLQSPVVVSLLALVMLVAALNMAGVFTIGPIGGRLLAVADRQSGPAQDVMSGALVVLLATPCSAPFISSAAGYALASGAVPALTVFTAIAVGLAWPVVLVAFAPTLHRLVPKPGPWMLTLRQFLVFPLLATAAWLAWVVGRQAGVDVMGALLAAMTIAGLALWLFGTLSHSGRAGTRYAGVALAGTGLVLAVSVAVGAASIAGGATAAAVTHTGGAGAKAALAWQPYSDSTLTAARASGLPVMLDVTADWCLTCKVNERLALGAERVRAALEADSVQLLRADWTSRSPGITRLINGFGRSGVPVVVLYPPGDRSRPVLLPTLLTPGIVIEALASMPGPDAVLQDSARVADSTRTPDPSHP